MLRRVAESTIRWLKRVITQPREELDRWQAAVRFAHDLGRFGARQLQHDRAQQMAAALSFRTLFGLLPVLVVATILVKALGTQESFVEPLDKTLEFWGLDDVHIVPPTGVEGGTTTLGVWLHERVREAIENVNVAAIGWVGVVITIYAAISLVVTIENCFNVIYRASQGRLWKYRVPLYWFLLTISPLILASSTYVNTRFEQLLQGLDTYQWLTTSVGVLWSLFAIWLLMLTVYMLFPNTKVHWRPAMIGALVSTILLEIGKRTMGMYLANALSISQLYGSLGLIPLFMFWVYLMWLAVLFGLQVSSTLQHLHGRQLAELEQQQRDSTIIDPAVVPVIMKAIGERFREGQTTSIQHIASVTGLPDTVTERIVDQLAVAGLLHRVADSDRNIALSRPPQEIPVQQLLDIAFKSADLAVDEPGASQLLDSLRAAQKDATAGATLATLLDNGAEA
ncbi:MAG: YihY family inner membrane protein [Planctomycetes bacterium]|nr:YihY family inner membrane protein [Planctomycetota bacterium]MBL7041776.1 YihY family inner membrane protein [Pirellulaceae bacterium]